MRLALRRCGALCALLTACGGAPGTAPTGAPCTSSDACASGFCVGFPGGYCSADCAQARCDAGESCTAIDGRDLCLARCATAADCRPGYMCFERACRPACAAAPDCARGYGCARAPDGSTACVPLPGKPVGATCASDADCASRDCDLATGACQLACARDDDCPAGQTCFVNPTDTRNVGATDGVRPICISFRAGTRAVGMPCTDDSQCTLGACELGRCATLCQLAAQCPSPLGCFPSIARVDDGAPTVGLCLPTDGVLAFDLPAGTTSLGTPAHAVSLTLFVLAANEDPAYFAGLDNVTTPAGDVVYSSQVDYYTNPLRFQPAEGSATLLLSNSPQVPFAPLGLYGFTPFAVSRTGQSTGESVRAFVKLSSSGPPTAGTLALHVFVTDLAGGCLRTPFDAASAPSRLGAFEDKLRAIFAQANITVDPITYSDSTAPASFTMSSTGPSPELDSLLKTATAADAPGNLELVLVRSIASDANPGFQVLGISGGIPGAPGIPGTLHSGAAAAITAWCNGGPDEMALTAAHELAHSLGLFHTVEQDGHTDLCPDDDHDGPANLMYWEEGSVMGRLSPCQSQVLLANPIVRTGATP